MTATIRFRFRIGYDGTGFNGWAKQPTLRTVQGVLEDSLNRLFSRSETEALTLTVAGRTDTGVHARDQIAHLDLPVSLMTEQLAQPRMRKQSVEWVTAATAQARQGVAGDSIGTDSELELFMAWLCKRLNRMLQSERDLMIHEITVAPPGFDARFSAVWRRYEYRIADRDARHDPLHAHRTVWLQDELDEARMNDFTSGILGLHDFATFCKPRPGSTTIRTLQHFSWSRDSEGVLIAQLQADAFCHSMVRALVGASAAVGEGRITVAEALELHANGERTSAFKVFPAHGLTLIEVGYPEAGFAAQAEKTRALRELPSQKN